MFPNILFVYQLQFAFLILESVWCSSPAFPITTHSGLCYYLSYPCDLYIFSKLLVELKKTCSTLFLVRFPTWYLVQGHQEATVSGLFLFVV